MLYLDLSSLGVLWHPQILTDQLTLSQPRGLNYAHQIVLAPPNFQTFRRPCMIHHKYIIKNWTICGHREMPTDYFDAVIIKIVFFEHFFVSVGLWQSSQYKCPTCNVSASTKQNLKTHIESAHWKKRPQNLSDYVYVRKYFKKLLTVYLQSS